jgi:hypothetical protein
MGRVVGIGDHVDLTNVVWTCFEYHDVRKPQRLHSESRRLRPRATGPCVKTPYDLGPARRPSVPSKIIRPDQSIILLSEVSGGGPGRIVADATGHHPTSDIFFTIH